MEKLFNSYLLKHSVYPALITREPTKGLKTIVIIPVFCEPDVLKTLESLLKCEPSQFPVEVIVLINNSEASDSCIIEQNQITFSGINQWINLNSTPELTFHSLYLNGLPIKHAGVGLARKIAMDEALRRFDAINDANGVIVSLDADTLVSPNYLKAIEGAFLTNSPLNLATFCFEHPITAESSSGSENEAIILYELYLRYFKHALQATGFPFAYYTIGSCFAIRASVYVKQGGMNRRKAGEDFYFLHKIFPLGGYVEMKDIFVYPSSRKSDRVPFGTGAAVKKIVTDGFYLTYQPIYFKHLKQLFTCIPELYGSDSRKVKTRFERLPESIQSFISAEEFESQIQSINQNSATEKTFVQRFYQWFDAFKVIKYLNFTHIETPRIPILSACQEFTREHYKTDVSNYTGLELLEMYRKMDKI
ncbi:MAG: glycosyltransferase [Salinivirgaceae bacterium]